MEFKVTVSYNLVSYQKGKINIGFNDETPLASTMQEQQSVAITSSTGKHTFTIKAKVRDWDTHDFLVYVNIEETDTENNSNVYYPIVTDKHVVIAKD